MKPAPFEYCRADTLDHALELFDAAPGYAKYLAGGQSLGPMINLRLAQVDRLIDVSRVADLRSVQESPDAVLFGAGIRHAEFEDGKVADASLGLMRRVARTLAYRAVRNRGTLGGSIAHADPVADWPSVMMALDAKVHMRGRAGRRSLAVSDFFVTHLTTVLDEDEIITAIEIPRLAPGTRVGFQKFCRKAGEFAHALAVAIRPPDGPARLVLGCAAGTPIRLEQTAALLGPTLRWTPDGQAALRHAIDADLSRLGVELDDYDATLHATIASRAVREVLDA